MENEPLYPLTIVDEDEFRVLSQLPDYVRVGNCLTRLGGDVLEIVMREDEHAKLQGYHEEMERDLVRQDVVIEPEKSMSQEIALPSPSLVAPIPPEDVAAAQFYFSDTLPERPPSDRPHDWRGGGANFSPLF